LCGPTNKGERIPLTIAGWDRKEGSVTIVFMEVGASTRQLACMKAGDSLANFAGPLGLPAHVENFGKVVCVAGGFGVAVVQLNFWVNNNLASRMSEGSVTGIGWGLTMMLMPRRSDSSRRSETSSSLPSRARDTPLNRPRRKSW
jgi:hypothetical protein